MAFFPGRSPVERDRSAGPAVRHAEQSLAGSWRTLWLLGIAVLEGRPSFRKAHPKKEIRHAIDNRIWHILRHDSHCGWSPVHACGKCPATIALRAIGDSAQPDDDTREYF
jgi:hypothetical protein